MDIDMFDRDTIIHGDTFHDKDNVHLETCSHNPPLNENSSRILLYTTVQSHRGNSSVPHGFYRDSDVFCYWLGKNQYHWQAELSQNLTHHQ